MGIVASHVSKEHIVRKHRCIFVILILSTNVRITYLLVSFVWQELIKMTTLLGQELKCTQGENLTFYWAGKGAGG